MQHRKGTLAPLKSRREIKYFKVLQAALRFHQQGKFDEAKELCDEVLKKDTDNFDAIYLSAVIEHRSGNFANAELLYKRAISIEPRVASVYLNFGDMLHGLKRFDDALALVEKLIESEKNFAEAYFKIGVICFEIAQLERAVSNFSKAILVKPDYADAYFNRGIALRLLKSPLGALSSYDKAILLKPNFADAHFSRGNVLKDLNQCSEALDSYRKAISHKADFAEAYSLQGKILHQLNRFEDSFHNYNQALAINANNAELFYNCGVNLGLLKRIDEALLYYDKAVSINPDLNNLLGAWMHTRMQLCVWDQFDDMLSKLKAKIIEERYVTTPYPLLYAIDDLQLHSEAARKYVTVNFPDSCTDAFEVPQKVGAKIRLAYFSADFRNHPMSQLMAGIFESHDRNKFELFGFSLAHIVHDEMRDRIVACFDHFVEVGAQSDQDVAQMCKALKIDIAVDLMGFTQGSRTGIFYYRCAPVQINFLGFAGTLSADFIDYIIVDKTIVPPDLQKFYREKFIFMPDSYYPNSYKLDIDLKSIVDIRSNRAENGLPEDSFVFCCFNKSFKITPTVFESWMRILSLVQGSVIWLLDDNPTSTQNLRQEASRRGVSPERLVFARRAPLLIHLSRHRCADLFLDTFPYNAHTTATDALWAGLPILTRVGESFASRVGASLLTAVGLPELITSNIKDYERLAIQLATHRSHLKSIKQKLSEIRVASRLFDYGRYVAHLEASYIAIYQRSRAGLAPEDLDVDLLDDRNDKLVEFSQNESVIDVHVRDARKRCTAESTAPSWMINQPSSEMNFKCPTGTDRIFRHRGSKADKSVLQKIFKNQEYSISRLNRFNEIMANFYDILNSGKKQLIVDVGANIGASVVWFSVNFPGSHIMAFESDVPNFELLAANSSGLDVEIHNVALGSADGWVSLIDPGRGESAYRTVLSEHGTRRLVSLPRILSEKISKGFIPFIIKIDIEGGEDNLFKNDAVIINEFPLLIIQLHDWLLPSQRSSRNFLNWVAEHNRDFVYSGENIFSIRNS